ncbi:MAG: SpoIID/LytB domain-containing protein [Firmicutes bacterium]|nr:SpoIID/LytB domain-containing protein [Bacillota bacterium]
MHKKNSTNFSGKILITISVLLLVSVLLSCGCGAREPVKQGSSEVKTPPAAVTPKPSADVEKASTDVILVKSPSSINFFGWKGASDFENAAVVLKKLGINFEIISDTDLGKKIPPCKIIVLANARCLNMGAMKNIREFSKNGGKVFATYMSGYRDQNNELPGKENNFIIADVYGVDFSQWVSNPTRCEYMQYGKNRVQLGRNQAMLVKPSEGSAVEAVWLKPDGSQETEGGLNLPAIVINKNRNCVYCSEDLFAPENSDSAVVLSIIAELFEKLEPGVVKAKINSADRSIKPEFVIPSEITDTVKPAGPVIRAWLGNQYPALYISCADDLVISSDNLEKIKKDNDGGVYTKKTASIPVRKNDLVYFMPVSVADKAPYINIYDSKNKLVARSVSMIRVKHKSGFSPIKLVDLNKNGTYSFSAYRGNLEFSPAGTGLMKIVNELTLDEYVAGVVPREVPSSYPDEALNAMAVVARTFAANSMGRHKDEGADVCNTVHCQVYGGVMGEALSTDKAVTSTAGEMILSGGKPAFTTFHSTCGGYGADLDSAWGGTQPYLVGGFDGPGEYGRDLSDEKTFRDFIDNPPACYCSKSGRFRWTQTYNEKDLQKAFGESLGKTVGRGALDTGRIRNLTITKRAKDGRALNLEIICDAGVFNVEKDKMRWLTNGGKIGTGGLPSTLLYIKKDGDKFIIKGAGWGHGVGMCQEGAKGMALAGKKYREIILHYYPGTEIK